MPTLVIKTNVELSKKKQEAVIKECSALVSKHLPGKPEAFVMVAYETTTMSFAGTFDPCASVTLVSVKSLGPIINGEVVEAISDVLEREVEIPPNRTYLQFTDVRDPFYFGWNRLVGKF